MSSTLESTKISLQQANDLLKAGFPAIPESVQKYIEYRREEKKERDVFPAILSEYPAEPGMPADKAQALAVRVDELEGPFQEFARNKALTVPEGKLAEYLRTLAGFLDNFPYPRELKLLWCNSPGYWRHGPTVLNAMNSLLAGGDSRLLKGCQPGSSEQQAALETLREIVAGVRKRFATWERDTLDGIMRLAALYHDLGKYIINERHPTIGWFIAEYIDDGKQKDALRKLLGSDQYLQLLLTIIRDHDQFGVLTTGEASYPILTHATSETQTLQPQQVISALVLCNLADMIGTFDIDGETIRKLKDDWEWVLFLLEHKPDGRETAEDYVLRQASTIDAATERVWRLLAEASRYFNQRHTELDKTLVNNALWNVFGNKHALEDFARQFARVCKLDYGKRFFEAMIQYCEGPLTDEQVRILKENHVQILPRTASKREPREKVVYSALACLKRITTTYAIMLGGGSDSNNMIGVEMKDLVPPGAPEKTAQIIELIISNHYPGLTWMVSDVPAWFF